MVHFIGAGPGDPELLTIKGKKINRSGRCNYLCWFFSK